MKIGSRGAASRSGRRLTYANVMSTIAVFGVFAGGGAYAASQIGVGDIKKNAVRAKHIKKNQVKGKHIAANAVTADKLACAGNGAADKMVRAGSVCIDRYENSIWTKRTGGTQITGAIPCDANGQDCKGKIFARSVAGVKPQADITWFQAQQALANSGKRLPTNAEWQTAVAGTPDSAACHVTAPLSAENTGSNAGCISGWGANDMVGNLAEWVADWDEEALASCSHWPAAFGADQTCVGRGSGEASTRFPGALVRGGRFGFGTDAGPFAVSSDIQPLVSGSGLGFRGAR